jgi:hypothetical protein
LPQWSVARQWTVVAPTGNTLPEGGVQTTSTLGSHASLAPTLKKTFLPTDETAVTVMSDGQLIMGGVVSLVTSTQATWLFVALQALLTLAKYCPLLLVVSGQIV